MFELYTVTTRNFRSFSEPRQFTIHRLLFIVYYSPTTIHYFTIHRFWDPFVILRSVTIHETLFILAVAKLGKKFRGVGI